MAQYRWAIYVPTESFPRELDTEHELLVGQLLVLDGIEYEIIAVEPPDALMPDRRRVRLKPREREARG